MNLLKRHWLIASLVVVGIAVFAAFRFKGNDQPKYFTAKVDRGNISQVVEATGTINAVTTVPVGSQVSGTISRLNADFNSRAKKGQVVAQIDPSLFEGSRRKAHSSAKQLDFPSCTFVPFVVNGLSSPHQITAVTSPNSIDHV